MVIIASVLAVIALILVTFILLTLFMLIFDLLLELPYVGTNRKKIETIMKFAQLKKGQTVVDLGSGDGRLLIASAQQGAFAIGYEINPIFIFLSKFKSKARGVSDHIKIYQQSLWKADLKVADVIFVYALRKSMKKFEDFIYKNAQPDTRIIVNTNPFPNRKPIKFENGIYLYIV